MSEHEHPATEPEHDDDVTPPAQPDDEPRTDDAPPAESPDLHDDHSHDIELGDAPAEPPAGDATAVPPMSEREIEARMAKLEKEATRHANRVSEVMGEDAEALEPCPLCWPLAPGFVLPPYFDANADAIKRAVRSAWGEADEPEYETADNARQCDACRGHGKRLSGSLVPDQRVLLCSTCGGRGWVAVGGREPHPDLAQTGDVAETMPVVAGEPKPDTDPWGRVPSDPNYGKLPQYV